MLAICFGIKTRWLLATAQKKGSDFIFHFSSYFHSEPKHFASFSIHYIIKPWIVLTNVISMLEVNDEFYLSLGCNVLSSIVWSRESLTVEALPSLIEIQAVCAALSRLANHLHSITLEISLAKTCHLLWQICKTYFCSCYIPPICLSHFHLW